MDSRKICFITCVNNKQLYHESLYYINQLEVPDDYEIECIAIENATSMIKGYNEGMKASDAKYKVYLHQDAYILNKYFIKDILNIFQSNDKIGMLGLAGAEILPTNGVWWESEHKYGKVYDSHTGKMELLCFKEIENEYERVQAIDGLIMVTQCDILWREDLFDGWHFYDISQSIEFIKKGYEVIIPRQKQPWVMHDGGIVNIQNKYEFYRKVFLEEYSRVIINIFIDDIKKGKDILDEDVVEWRNYYVEKNNSRTHVEVIDNYLISKFNLNFKKNSELFDFDKITALEIVNDNRKEFFKYIHNAKVDLYNKNYEGASKWCFQGAKYASENHPGFYTSLELEKILIECARYVPKVSYKLNIPKSNSKKRKILHVLSEGYSIGGHTRLVKNWIEKDNNSIHSIITTWQIDSAPKWLINAAIKSGGWTYSLQQIRDYMERASALRKIAYEWADIIVLHIHMYDVIPVIAFGVDGGPPVLFMNHADHLFWVGASVVDNLINFRKSGDELSKTRRYINRTSLLPIPLELPNIKSEFKDIAKRKLGINEDTVVLLTIASANKFKTFSKIHYIDILKRVLNMHDNAIVIVVGPSNTDLWEKANKETKGKIIPIGIQYDIEKYYAIADIYVDSYMFASATSALDGGLSKLPIVALQNQNNKTLSFDDISYSDDKEFDNIDDFMNYISKLISDKEYREKEGRDLYIQIQKQHINKWCDYLNKIYEKSEDKPHKIYLNNNITDSLNNEDLSLALFQNGKIQYKNSKPVILPESVSKPITEISVDSLKEDIMIEMQPQRHKMALKKVRKKKIVKVAFFATFSSVWKYHGVYQLMKQDPRFDPIVIVCPVVNYGKENMLAEMEKSYNFFKNKGYNVVKAYNKETDTFLDVKQDINPDIIFYTNPYQGLIMEEYYITNFLDTLTCYTNYAFYVTNRHKEVYGQLFNSILWKTFYETTIHVKMAKDYDRNKGNHVVVTGYPSMENLIYGSRTSNNVWKNCNENMKRIIWAPHHTIDLREGLGFSNFLKYHKFMLNIADEYKDRVQIAFKPHPLLKVKLYEHPEWGKERTDKYYSLWENNTNTQVETDEYIDLFNSSDAMILDSGSFVVEYLYCGKPSLFTFSDPNIRDRFNEFGKLALDQHYNAYNENDIINFINQVCNEEDIKKAKRKKFYNKYLLPPNNKSASANIYDEICRQLFELEK